MNRFIVFLLLCLFTVQGSMSQNFKFRKVSKEEVAEQEHPLEAEAEAAYLYRNRHTYYTAIVGDINLTSEIHQRIKIYEDEGFQYADFEILLYQGDNGHDRLSGLKAYTYNLEDGKVREYKLDKDDIFEESISDYRKKVTFTMPKVQKGSVLEVSYKITSTYYLDIDPFTFQFGIPVNKIEARFSAPESFTFKPRFKGYYPFSPERSSRHNPSTQMMDAVYSFDLNNVPSMKAESYVDNINNYRAGMSFELSKIEVPGSYYKSFSHSWEDVTKQIYDGSLGVQLNKKGYFKDEIDPIVESVSDPSERALRILEFVKEHMNWNEVYGYYCQKGVRQAYKDQTGNVGDINIMLTAMLRYAGLEANPVLVSTKSHGIPLFPTREGFNYVICAVETGDSVVLLDATSKLSVPNILPYRVLNWDGRLVREDGSSEAIDLSSPVKSKNSVNAIVKLNEDGSVEGRLRKQLSSHWAYGFRNQYLNMDEDEYLEELENKYSGIEIEEYQISNKSDYYKPVMEDITFYKEEAIEIISGKYYLNPLLFFTENDNPFKSEDRVYPIDFKYPETTSYVFNYTLPEGYSVESLPESTKFALPDDLGSFAYQIISNGANLQVRVTYDMNKDVVPADYYQAMKAFMSEIISKESEKVVITKV